MDTFATDVLGREPDALPSSWATFCERLEKSKSSEEASGKLRKLDSALAKVTFFEGGREHTSADVVLVAALSAWMPKFSRTEYCAVPSVTRWYDHMQYLLREQLEAHGAALASFNLEYQAPKKKAKKQQQPKGEKKKDKEAKKKKKTEEPAEDPFLHLEFRVGVVLSAEEHPDADSLYVEQVDLGEGEPRTIVSGLRQHVPLDKFIGSRVLIIANLPPRAIRGIKSRGMVCCASNADHTTVELLTVPDGVAPGTRVSVAGFEIRDVKQIPKKKKYWQQASEHLSVAGGRACYKGEPLEAGDGVYFTCETMQDALFG